MDTGDSNPYYLRFLDHSPSWVHKPTMCLGFCTPFLNFQQSLLSLWISHCFIEKGQLYSNMWNVFFSSFSLWPLFRLRLIPFQEVPWNILPCFYPLLSFPSTSVQKSEVFVSTVKRSLHCFKTKNYHLSWGKRYLSKECLEMAFLCHAS